ATLSGAARASFAIRQWTPTLTRQRLRPLAIARRAGRLFPNGRVGSRWWPPRGPLRDILDEDDRVVGRQVRRIQWCVPVPRRLPRSEPHPAQEGGQAPRVRDPPFLWQRVE